MTTRSLISTPTTWYVDNDTGSDANDGSTAALAFATIQHALNTLIAASDFAVTPTLQLQTTGVPYAEAVQLNRWVGSAEYFRILGDPFDNSAVLVAPPIGAAFTSVNGSPFQLESIKIQTSAGYYGIVADAGAHVLLKTMNFGPCGVAHMFAEHTGFLEMLIGTYTVSGGAMWHAAAGARGHFLWQGTFVNFSGTPRFSQSIALGSQGGFIDGRLFLGWGGAYVSGNPHGVSNDGTALMLTPNVGYWP